MKEIIVKANDDNKKNSTLTHPPRFILDSMLGKLTRWLRIFGFDSLYYLELDDSSLLNIALSGKRILLTRDRLLFKRALPNSYFIINQRINLKLREVVERFSLYSYNLPTRCPICNSILRRVNKSELLGIVPENVTKTYNEFYLCPGCGKVYWHGSHWERIVKSAKKVGVNLQVHSGRKHW